MKLRPRRPAALDEARSLLGGRYPSFVLAARPGPLPPGEVPVFMFHTVRPDTFDAQLRHLARNGYRTPSLDEFHAFLADGARLPDRSVLLTFDDVERGLLTDGVPLLRRHGFRCVAFVAPGRIGEAPRAGVPGGRKTWPGWDDVRAMAASGVVEIGSHSLHHAAVFAGERPADFVHPGAFVDGLGLDAPWVRTGGTDAPLEALGAPLHPAAPRLAGLRRYLDDERLRAACVRFAAGRGGEAFFRDPAWRRRLAEHWRAARAAGGDAGRWETPAEQRAAMRLEFAESRRLLEERLGLPVRDFAYPWASGGDLAVELSREAGYRTNFWGPLPGLRTNRAGQDPFRVVRLKDDYLMRLPGEGRVPLAAVLLAKARRRRRSEDIY